MGAVFAQNTHRFERMVRDEHGHVRFDHSGDVPEIVNRPDANVLVHVLHPEGFVLDVDRAWKVGRQLVEIVRQERDRATVFRRPAGGSKSSR